ncbi:glycosyl hydrolase family protein [Alginatibacterium sediminis]|uniref:Beta-amylase n=1 Tax=Alginatibacterium sediminis TaxID=2164068 RepID=A0A420E8K9_9ALTE|nr:family 14 glycosylhydrolase [Alginatibacterium sediminis]RKF15829.1 glycosyl hydrolase family protein [Alginatibacterium sediminis]
MANPITVRKAWVKGSLPLAQYAASCSKAQLQGLSPQLRKLRQNGIDALIVPVHWRYIAPFSAQQLDQASSWSSLQRLSDHLLSHGFKLQYQLFFSADTQEGVEQRLPDWFWGSMLSNLPENQTPDAIKYVNQFGLDTTQSPSLWAQSGLSDVLGQWIAHFANHMRDYAQHCNTILLGLGPNGDACYPWAERDAMPIYQSFSPSALSALANDMTLQYGSLDAWLNAWQLRDEKRWQEQLGDKLTTDYQSKQLSLCLTEFSQWYAHNWRKYVGTMLAQAQRNLLEDWSNCQLALNLPMPESSASEHAWLGCLTGINPQPWLDRTQQFDYQLDQLSYWNTQANGRLLVIASGAESSHAARINQALLGAIRTLKVPALVQNAHSQALSSHPGWDQLYHSVLHGGGFDGWIFNDMSLLNEQSIVKSRLSQLNKFKYQVSETKQLGKKQFRVMGPLHLKVANQKQLLDEENWKQFEEQLRQLRSIGVTAISTDIWWGLVEGDKPGKFDWSYYDRVVTLLQRLGLQWVPILSFHQAGGNVNDDYMQAIPLWLWGRLLESNDQLNSVQDLQYVSETGDASMEYVSLWADEFVMPYYQRFMEAFKQHFINQAGLMDEINVSLGPAGELRYPSYNSHDWGNYPNRGTLQCYSRLAKLDWLNYLKQKFHNIAELNASFGYTWNSFEQAEIPDAEWLFSHKRYIHNAWAREFLTWYHKALVAHGRRIFENALQVFDDESFGQVPIGIKVPGIHWVVSDPELPRTAEITAGLIAVHPTLNCTNQHEYVGLLKSLLPEGKRARAAIHFTCLEMINKDYEGYSRAADLVAWMADAAEECQVSLMGENALAGELYSEQGWKQMARALSREPGYDGLTLLRMQNFFDDEPTPMRELKTLINRIS